MLTDRQKDIYNLYLKALAEVNDRPYRKRNNFSNLREDTKGYLSKIEHIFDQYPQFFRYEYFLAPFKLYNDKKFVNLKYLSTYKGINTCVSYFKTLKESNPDDQLSYIKSSLKFITEFCVEQNIPLSLYCKHKSVVQNSVLIHLKQHKISFYVIFDIPNLYTTLLNMPDDEFELYFGSDINLQDIYVKYNSSKKAKDYIKKSVPKIEEYLKKNLIDRAKCGKL